MLTLMLQILSCNRITTPALRVSSSVVSGIVHVTKMMISRNEGREFQHIGPETAKSREPNVTVLVRGKSRSPWVASCMWRRWRRHTEWRQIWWSLMMMLAFIGQQAELCTLHIL